MDLLATDDQTFLWDTTRTFLERECPLTTVRELAGSADGFDRDFWRQGASLGWTSLLVPEALGGGAITGTGVADLAGLAEVFGAHAAPGPLLPTNVVAAALARRGTAEQQAELVGGLLSGETVAAWAHAQPARPALAPPAGVTATRDGDDLVLTGVKAPVEAGAQADVLLVTAATTDGPVQVLVDPRGPGVAVTPLESVDLARRYARVELDGARVPASAVVGDPATGRDDIEWQLQLAAVVQSAEIVGAAQVAFDLTLAWTFDRYTFGRPLASYQAIKHRVADMRLWLEAGHALAAAAAADLDAGAAAGPEVASAAKAYTGEHLTDLVQECIQLHGGIGLTYDHDLHLFLRRVVADRVTHGTPAEHRMRVTDFRELAS